MKFRADSWVLMALYDQDVTRTSEGWKADRQGGVVELGRMGR